MRKHLCKDGAYLTYVGTNTFAEKIVSYISHFIFKEFWNDVAYNNSHFEDQNRDTDKGSPENSSENTDSSLKNKQDLNSLSEVKKLRLKNVNKTVRGQINIALILSKFDQLKKLVLKQVVRETKLDETFPNSQFHMDGFFFAI